MKDFRRLYKYNLKEVGKFYCLLFFMNMKLIISELFHLPLNVFKKKIVRMEIENRFSRYKFTYQAIIICRSIYDTTKPQYPEIPNISAGEN